MENKDLEWYYKCFPDKRPIENTETFEMLKNMFFGDGERVVDNEAFKKHIHKKDGK